MLRTGRGFVAGTSVERLMSHGSWSMQSCVQGAAEARLVLVA